MIDFLQGMLGGGEAFTVDVETRDTQFHNMGLVAVDKSGLVLQDRTSSNHVCVPWSAVDNVEVSKD